MKKILPIALLALAIGVGIMLWRQIGVAEAPRDAASAPPTAAASSSPATPTPAEQKPPAVKFPVPVSSAELADGKDLPSLENSDAYMTNALGGLLGADFVYKQLQLKEFVHRCVATLDNLGRSSAPSAVWPINPTAGRFSSLQTEAKDGTDKETIMPDNEHRYDPVVKVVDTLNTYALAKLYFGAYPLFQQAYQDIGFPKAYFNDRLVEVLDVLIATPEPAGPLEVHLVDVQGSVKSTRPWVRYEFTDPALQSLTAGQKIMLRVGKQNRQILRRKLTEFRDIVASKKAPG